ncbi:hypothetical protein HYALB_00009328 [Hymenoscyphus albidus]|uniref:Uncharacterized protein n=1 Tax=Hymenoscyphus albidus TaxID=595503 RepID=A0A9N9LLD7_9HELO|nr:hypothetical protein HYALB_00009328 [Hymenoscyphus albidus]
MAGHNFLRDSLEDDRTVLTTHSFKPYDLVPTRSNYNVAEPSPTPSPPNAASSTQPPNAIITEAPHLELRQNNPQDCKNLCDALVDRAKVEKERTIIALNGTYNQQIEAARIAAVNGIRQAQVEANSTVNLVIRRADIVTSAASADVLAANKAVASADAALTTAQANATLANIALTSCLANATQINSALDNANAALRNVSSASINEVARLSSTILSLQGNVASAAAAAAAASAAASSANDAAAAAATKPGSCLIPPPAGTSPDVSITSAQVILIVIGGLILVFLLGFAGYFLVSRKKRMGERDSYLDEKDSASSPRRLNSRMSSAYRTGNGMKIQYNPRNAAAHEPMPTVTDQTGGLLVPSNANNSNSNVSGVSVPPTGLSMVPVGSPIRPNTSHSTSVDSPDREAFEAWSLKNRQNEQIKRSPRFAQGPKSPMVEETATAVSYAETPAKSELITNSYPIFYDQLRVQPGTDVAPRKPSYGKTERKRSAINVTNPFDVQPTSPVQKAATQGHRDLPLATDDTSQDIKTTILDVKDTMMDEPLSVPITFFSNYENPFLDPAQATPKSKEAEPRGFTAQTPKTPKTPRREVFDLEKLLSPKKNRFPAPETLAMLRQEEAPRTSTVPEIDRLLQLVAKQNEKYSDKPLFWTDFRPPDPEVETSLSVPLGRESPEPLNVKKEPVVEKSPEVIPSPPVTTPPPVGPPPTIPPPAIPPPKRSPVTEREEPKLLFNIPVPPIPESNPRDRTLSPLRRNPVIDRERSISARPSLKSTQSSESTLPTPDPNPGAPDDRELSPLRRNPSQVRNITSLLAEQPLHINTSSSPPTAPPTASLPVPGTESETHGERGRSMIRTSDIIEARLSWKSQLAKQDEEALKELDQEKRDRAKSPLRRNPVDLEALRRSPSLRSYKSGMSGTTANTNSPPPMPQSKRRSITLSPPPRHDSIPPVPVLNPSQQSSSPPVRNSIQRNRSSNPHFSQVLERFQVLASQNSVDKGALTNEVTQRAIAGIYIPGSLREQAVRNSSSSRGGQVGRSTSRGPQAGIGNEGLGRSASSRR